MSKSRQQIVWFKRDLRVHDHCALHAAAEHGPLLPLYILEPELWQQPDLSHRHYSFLAQSLKELNQALLDTLGQPLIIRIGEASDILDQLYRQYHYSTVWSHQETWNGWTYERDRKVQAYLRAKQIPWHQPRQFGIVRALKNRDGWSHQWNQFMSQPVRPAPKAQAQLSIPTETIPTHKQLGLQHDGALSIQTGGRSQGIALLDSFLHQRGEPYTKAMSSPLFAFDACSRLSAHIAFGTLSLREIYQAVKRRSDTIKALPRGQKGKWPSALRSFAGRLRWHCHFMQKLEDEPRIEFENFHHAYDGLREHEHNETHYQAWATGHTGYPMVDACMRALIATGWINFRMRAMLMSFASYHLWLHWRPTSLHLARQFSDYEPGIHYSQCQMQSGTTGINSIRIYNPTKQGLDHDPDGIFIRQWIPELREIPRHCIHQPWAFPDKLNGYPTPIVDEALARKSAAAKIYALRRQKDHRAEAQAIVKKHGSRKTTERQRKPRPTQTELSL
ncbi:MAG: deoxyribodipyrimidine photo-lyase [Lentimonas sp.]|jgi:deoxyribodipyrimidine photo-lyase